LDEVKIVSELEKYKNLYEQTKLIVEILETENKELKQRLIENKDNIHD